jgi:hypothetical protein
MRLRLLACSLLILATPVHADDDFNYFEGKWTLTTGAGDDIGQPIWFHKAIGGWDAVFGWWGQTTISQSSEYGSHIKISGTHGERCYYYVAVINRAKMAWNLRYRDTGDCPRSVVFERDP